MTTKTEIRKWLKYGKKHGATHVIVVCDTFDNEDYPVYVKHGEHAYGKASKYDGHNMQRVMEVYNLAMDFETQLKQHRVFNF